MVTLAFAAALLAAGWGEDAGWREVKFGPPGATTLRPALRAAIYPARRHRVAGQHVAVGAGAAIDLAQTPILCWRWRVSHALKSADMATKSGDDYAARVYVAFSLPKDSLSGAPAPSSPWPARSGGDTVPDAALNRVGQPAARGPQRPNAYTAQTQMVVQRSGAALSGRWVHRVPRPARRRRQMAAPGAKPVMLAVAADTDNTGEQVTAEFADLGLCGRPSLDEPQALFHAQMHVHALHRPRRWRPLPRLSSRAIKITWLSEANTKMSTRFVSLQACTSKKPPSSVPASRSGITIDKTLAGVVRHHRGVNRFGRGAGLELAQMQGHAHGQAPFVEAADDGMKTGGLARPVCAFISGRCLCLSASAWGRGAVRCAGSGCCWYWQSWVCRRPSSR